VLANDGFNLAHPIASQLSSYRRLTMSDHNVQVEITGTSVYGSYEAARAVASIFAFFGWVIVAVGVVASLAGLAAGPPFNFVLAAGGVGVGAIGLLLVAAEQMLRAAVDSADYSRQALLLQIGLAQGKAQIDLGRTSPTQGGAPAMAVPMQVRAGSSGDIEETYEYKGRRILKIGADYFVEGHDQPYDSLYTVRLIIDRGDV
jgi:hypothetical protein